MIFCFSLQFDITLKQDSINVITKGVSCKIFQKPFYKNSLFCLNFVYLLIELICLQPKSFLTVILLLKDNNFKDAQWVYFKQSFPILIRHWETWILCCWCWVLECELGKPSLKKTIFLLTFVNKDFSPPPLIIDEKPLRFGGPVRGVTPPFIKVLED